MNLKTIVLVCAALCAPLPAWAANKNFIHRSFEVKPGGQLQLDVDRGSIRIITSDTDKVEVRVIRELKRASESAASEAYDSHKVEISQEGNAIRVQAKSPQKFGRFWNEPLKRLQVDYDLTIPTRFNLQLRTSGGSIEIAEVEGEVEARTQGGTVTLKGARGNATLETSGGSIRVGRVDGKLSAHTSGGSITIDAVTGPIDAHTGGGNIEIMDGHGPIMAITSGGNVSARLSKQPSANSKLQTSGGNVTLNLGKAVAVNLSARTSGGRINSDFDGELNKGGTQFTAQVNGGGPDLILQTSGGNVNIRAK